MKNRKFKQVTDIWEIEHVFETAAHNEKNNQMKPTRLIKNDQLEKTVANTSKIYN